jgi:hypothetical protein
MGRRRRRRRRKTVSHAAAWTMVCHQTDTYGGLLIANFTAPILPPGDLP